MAQVAWMAKYGCGTPRQASCKPSYQVIVPHEECSAQQSSSLQGGSSQTTRSEHGLMVNMSHSPQGSFTVAAAVALKQSDSLHGHVVACIGYHHEFLKSKERVPSSLGKPQK